MDKDNTENKLLAGTEEVIEGNLKDEWDNFTDKQRLAVLAMLTCATDRQAMKMARITGRHFYRVKKQVLPYLDRIKKSITDQAFNVLVGHVLEASEVLSSGLKAPAWKYKLDSAREILDRVLGRAVQRSEIKSKEAVTVLNINASVEEIQALKVPLSPLDNEAKSK